MRGEGCEGLFPSVPLASLKWYITMVVIVVVAVAVVVRCYGERLSFKRSFFQTYFLTPWKARRGKRKLRQLTFLTLVGNLKV